MEKLEQIQNLLVEWQKESKKAYSLSVTGAIMGDEAVIVEHFADCITNSENPLHSVIGNAINKVAMRGFMKRIGNSEDNNK